MMLAQRLEIPECRIPAPQCCAWCGGAGTEPDDESIRCLECDGCALSWVEFDLWPTRTYNHRRVCFNPQTSCMAIALSHRWRTNEVKGYKVMEFQPGPGWHGRGFEVVKLDSDRHQVWLGRGMWPACTCQGVTYQASARANQLAWQEGRTLYPTYGCIHCDSLVPLVNAGWFDVGKQGEKS
jgi:hypothetical protein